MLVCAANMLLFSSQSKHPPSDCPSHLLCQPSCHFNNPGFSPGSNPNPPPPPRPKKRPTTHHRHPSPNHPARTTSLKPIPCRTPDPPIFDSPAPTHSSPTQKSSRGLVRGRQIFHSTDPKPYILTPTGGELAPRGSLQLRLQVLLCNFSRHPTSRDPKGPV